MTTLTAKLDWKGDDLYFARRKLISVVRDEKYSNMWRVLSPDGRVCDLANRTRAKDAALGRARRMISKTGRIRLPRAVLCVLSPPPCSARPQPAAAGARHDQAHPVRQPDSGQARRRHSS